MGGGNRDMPIEALKASPPVTVSALALGGLSLQDWVFILTLIYLVMQIGWFGWSKFIRGKPDSE